jgi:hypothetical protein
VRRSITQGLAYAYEPGRGLADEDAPLWVRPPGQFAAILAQACTRPATAVRLAELTEEPD